MKKFKRKVMIKNKNLICKKRRWFGQRPMCKEIKSKLKSSVLQQCDRSEAEKCEQLCIKRENGSEAKCYCHKGFRLIGTRCSGKFLKKRQKQMKIDKKISISFLGFSDKKKIHKQIFTFRCAALN